MMEVIWLALRKLNCHLQKEDERSTLPSFLVPIVKLDNKLPLATVQIILTKASITMTNRKARQQTLTHCSKDHLPKASITMTNSKGDKGFPGLKP